jgi:hypothetical protein
MARGLTAPHKPELHSFVTAPPAGQQPGRFVFALPADQRAASFPCRSAAGGCGACVLSVAVSGSTRHANEHRRRGKLRLVGAVVIDM